MWGDIQVIVLQTSLKPEVTWSIDTSMLPHLLIHALEVHLHWPFFSGPDVTRNLCSLFRNSCVPATTFAPVIELLRFRGSSVSMGTRLRLDGRRVRGWIPGRGQQVFCFPQRADRPWPPSSLRYNGHCGMFTRE
jgi:hypothetical protein